MLAMLADGPKHGYQLKRQAGFVLGQGEMHNNLVYPLLRRFTQDGLVTKKSVPGERGQTRHVYALSASGRKSLIGRLTEFSEADASSAVSFTARVGMFQLVSVTARDQILDTRERYLQGRQERLNQLGEKLDLGTFGGEVVRHMIEQTQAELAWIRRLRRLSRDKEAKESAS